MYTVFHSGRFFYTHTDLYIANSPSENREGFSIKKSNHSIDSPSSAFPYFLSVAKNLVAEI